MKKRFWKRKSWRIEDLLACAGRLWIEYIQSMIRDMLGRGKQSFEYRALRADGTYLLDHC